MNFNFGNIFGENSACKKTNVTFRISGDNIIPTEITNDIGINPTRTFAKGEVYKTKIGGIRQRPIGHWSISSEIMIDSTSTEEHAKYILEKLEPKTKSIKKYIENSNIRTSLIFWWEATDEHGGFTLSADTLGRLCQLCKDIDYQFIG